MNTRAALRVVVASGLAGAATVGCAVRDNDSRVPQGQSLPSTSTAAPAAAPHWSAQSRRPVAPDDRPLPLVMVTADNTVLRAPCRVAIAPGTIIADSDGNGVIHVEFADGEVRFEPGSVLRGSPVGAAPDSFAGTGVRIDGHTNVSIVGVQIEGFKVGLHARRAAGLTLDSCRFRDLWRHRLKSTPQAEDQGDWLWPHENDEQQWRKNYGAAACIEQSDGVTVRDCRVREGQNGLIIDRVNGAKIYDNDFSFLSGWGLAMWRSSENLICRNALDFCIRGYSHGVYNRGQDSAGILCFEQCSKNVFVENSATHGGDGFFGFAGKEALGEKPPRGVIGAGEAADERDAAQQAFDYTLRGCNGNVFVGNEFSYAAAHGLELTFSFGNVMQNNRFVENAICGIWAGYSSNTVIDVTNEFVRNGQAGYGVERGGVNIEHGSNNVIGGRFEGDTCGVHLWWDADEGIAKTPWAKANGTRSENNQISGRFIGCKTGVHLRETTRTILRSCRFDDCENSIVADATSQATLESLVVVTPMKFAPAPPPGDRPQVPREGTSQPVGARRHLAGRHNIIMTEWGPWDHESPLVRLTGDDGYQHRFDLFNLPDGELNIELTRGAAGEGTPGVVARAAPSEPGQAHMARVSVVAESPGVYPYELLISTGEGPGGLREVRRGTLINCRWEVRCFATPKGVDPREQLEAWRAAGHGPDARVVELNRMKLPFGSRGPSDLKLDDDAAMEVLKAAPALPREGFGTIASTVIPLSPGKWRISTLSDDGVRVRVRIGGGLQAATGGTGMGTEQTVIENWTHHGPTRDRGVFEVPVAAGTTGAVPVAIEVEHFELDGYAVLELEIERAD